MKRFSILTLIPAITLIISACGAKATPPPAVSTVDMQSTVAAAALTMMAKTQAAIPTATLPPPTEAIVNTPAPTNTLLPLPSLEVQLPTVVPTSNSGSGNACVNQPLPPVLQGRNIKIRIDNSTKVAVNITVYLNQTEPENVCGYRSYSLGPKESIVIRDLVEGCFDIWAWNDDPKHYFMVASGTDCINNSDTHVYDISTDGIGSR